MDFNNKRVVFINPHFELISQNNQNNLNTHGLPHINPLFQKTHLSSYLESYRNNSLQYYNSYGNNILENIRPNYSSNSKIYVNPKIFNHTNVNNIDNSSQSQYIDKHKSNNKFSKINPPIKNINNPKIETQLKEQIIPSVPKKPSRFLIRGKINNQVQNNKITKPSILRNSKYFKNKVWKQPEKLNLNSIKNKCFKKINPKQEMKIKTPQKLINTSYIKRNSILNKTNIMDTVYIGGEKYIYNNNKLTKIKHKSSVFNTSKKQKNIKQIIIKGKTFLRISENQFLAKNKAGREKLKKINLPCPFYRKYGKCKKFNLGKCRLVHDKKHISICKKFLQGACQLDGCFLSHNVTLEKMPTCKFYLEGCCTRNNCPYLHVKVNVDAKICLNFLQGFCPSGKDCNSLHINVCPEFYRTGKCTVVKCLFPHKNKKSNDIVINNAKNEDFIKNTTVFEIIENKNNTDENPQRYYCNVANSSEKVMENNETINKPLSLISRPSIGNLPSFIAFD